MNINWSSNKNGIIAIVALVVVCAGSFIGVRSLNNKQPTATPVAPPQINVQQTTVQPQTTAPVTTQQQTTAPAESTTFDSAANLITTFNVAQATTKAPETTTPSTRPSVPSTTEAITQPTTAAPVVVPPSSNNGNSNQSADVGNNNAIFDNGLASYKYDPSGNFYYTNSDPWQRYGGYNEIYDIGAGFVSIYMDTMRCKFEYGDKDWLIQFWKGQYGLVFVGHEIGVYTKPKDREVEHYDAITENDENALYMSMTGYRKGEELYTRDYGRYWWCTGFVPGTLDKFSDRSELSLKARITMKDYKMLLAFCGALKENGLVMGENFTTSGLDVFIEW